jgi:hypothetical protein
MIDLPRSVWDMSRSFLGGGLVGSRQRGAERHQLGGIQILQPARRIQAASPASRRGQIAAHPAVS